ncbi:hypothetical protein KI387_018634 [Taxus chinensis]|uniref:O-fucosyltransferase family protein n=1 Tax=Taxus chinensis TaxID=29808 RepID=A0AA38LCU4_TAXCH|nr:hypothetical protein KI387_018634 [Taxus chinensis]
MKPESTAESFGHSLLKVVSNVCFVFFVVAVLIFTVIAVTYKPPDPWLESSKAMDKLFSAVENATFKQDDSIVRTGEDIGLAPSLAMKEEKPVTSKTVQIEEANAANQVPTAECNPDRAINCSDPIILVLIKKFNLKVFPTINIFFYQVPVQGSKSNECDVAWRFRSKKEKSWRKYRDFRRYTIGFDLTCDYKVIGAGRWHSGKNARPLKVRKDPHVVNKTSSQANTGNINNPISTTLSAPSVLVTDEVINDAIPLPTSESTFRKGKYLYYSRGGDYCKEMNHYLWSLLCALGEAQYLNRTFVMDLSMCLSSKYTANNKDEEGKDFRYYFDFEHLKESTSIVEEEQFLKEWKKWDREHKKDRIPVRNVNDYKTSPMRLKKDKSVIIWRQFDAPEPDNYWYRVCEGRAEKFVQRPWQLIWKSKRLMNIVSAISGSLDWDFDAVHVVRGEKAQNKELWPNLDQDTSPDSILGKLTNFIHDQRKLYIATNEPDYHYFDKLRSHFKVSLLDDYKDLWGKDSEWFNETALLNKGQAVEFDGYMRVAVDTEVFYRAKTRVETFNNLTKDCKDGINTC